MFRKLYTRCVLFIVVIVCVSFEAAECVNSFEKGHVWEGVHDIFFFRSWAFGE